ncbi:MAG: CoA-binding protein [Patescibacteria group bacterium]|jgi:hypothetical protein
MKTVAIIGASNNREKFGNKAVRAYRKQGWVVYPINPKEAFIDDVQAYKSVVDAPRPIDRVSLYVPSDVGLAIINDIAKVRPKELYINPGAESEELVLAATKLGLEPIQACSIRNIGEDPGEY